MSKHIPISSRMFGLCMCSSMGGFFWVSECVGACVIERECMGACVRLITFIYYRSLMSVVYQGRQISQIVFLSQGFVVDLDKANAQLVSFVIDVFQLLQGFGTFPALWFIWCWTIRIGFQKMFKFLPQHFPFPHFKYMKKRNENTDQVLGILYNHAFVLGRFWFRIRNINRKEI